LTRYKKKFVTQPNPSHQALKTNPTRQVGLGWVRFDGFAGFLHTPNCEDGGEYSFGKQNKIK